MSCWWRLALVVHDVTGLGLGGEGYRAKALLGPLAFEDRGLCVSCRSGFVVVSLVRLLLFLFLFLVL